MGSAVSTPDGSVASASSRTAVQASAAGAGASTIAVTFSGWLGVHIPAAGRSARKALVDPMGADVLVAGTYLPSECGTKSACDALWLRLAWLGPFAARSLEPMPTRQQLTQLLAKRMPLWQNVKAAFRANATYEGLNIFTPLLGNARANVLRELLSYERVYMLLRQVEARRARKYERVLFSRLEYRWLAPHPPLAPFFADDDARRTVWAPPPDSSGFNDRHAVMARASAPIYFRRLSALFSPRVLARFTLSELVSLGPEQFLAEVLARDGDYRAQLARAMQGGRPLRPPRLRRGEFPLPAFLACCHNHSVRCWNRKCYAQRRGVGSGVGGGDVLAGRVHGKYRVELRRAVAAWRWLQCAGGGYEAGLRVRPDPVVAHDRLMQLVVPASNRALGIEADVEMHFVNLNRSVAGLPQPPSERDWARRDMQALGATLWGGSPPESPLRRAATACPLSHIRTRLGGADASVGWCAVHAPSDCPAEQHSLLDCAHACARCPTCAALSFSHDQSRCSLHRSGCAPSALLPPAEGPGWDVLHLSRAQAARLLDTARPGLQALPVALPGHCGPTADGEEGDCQHGARGSLPLFESTFNLTDELACVRYCALQCARCRFVSISRVARDCSWYAECNVASLALEPAWLRHKTYAVRPRARRA